MIKKMALLIFFLLTQYVSADDSDLQVYNMYKSNMWNYSIMLDKKWVMYMDFAHDHGMDNFFLPKGYNFNNAPAGIMVYVAYDDISFDKYIEGDLKNFISRNKEYCYEEVNNDVKNKYGMEIKVYHAYQKSNSIEQYFCYFSNGGKFFFCLVLQLFCPNETYVQDFYVMIENSQILPYLYSIQKND